MGGDFLPTTLDEAKRLGWHELDVIIVTGDAYVDHPSFGAALIGRWLQRHGYRVGILPQPDWRNPSDFAKLGKPRLFFGVTAGNKDSMVAHYTPLKRIRRDDPYSPGNVSGFRPNRATIVYTNRIREVFKDAIVLIGGVEASLRRFAHYDYWDDAVRRSILLDSKADMLIYGMGERQVLELCERLSRGEEIKSIRDVRGTVVIVGDEELRARPESIVLPSFEEVSRDRREYARSFKLIYENQNPFNARPLVQKSGDRWVFQNPPSLPMSTEELDAVYDAPFVRSWHPRYDSVGGIHALETVQFSLTTHRGCYGGCSFCALYFHQGPVVQSRSVSSVIREVEAIRQLPTFRGMISDIGGPTANMYGTGCKAGWRRCRVPHCLMPRICRHLDTDHSKYLSLLEAVRKVDRVKKVAVATGIRYDLALEDTSSRFIEELCRHYVSGQIKLAPEHVSDEVLRLMNKPPLRQYEEFLSRYNSVNRSLGKRQYYVQYFMSSHPGCTVERMIELAEYIRDRKFYPEQVQDFTPTPMTLSTCMYHTGLNPLTGEEVYVAKRLHEKRIQRALIQYANPANHALVREALIRAGRHDLIGESHKCLVKRWGDTIRQRRMRTTPKPLRKGG